VHGSNLPYVLAVQVGFCAALNLTEPVEEALWDSAFTLAFAGLVLGAGLAVRSMRGRATESAAHADALELQRDDAARTAAEQERQLLARELHDILAHGLGVIALQAGAAEHALDDDPDRARAALASVRATAQDAIGELETLVRAVRAQAASNRQPQPTLADLPRLVRQASCGDFLVDLKVHGEPRAVPAAIQASIYRVAQEGLTNAMKHSGTGSCGLMLAYCDQNVRIEVTDEGVRGSRAPGSRAGLAGVAERVSVVGGSVRVGPREQGGWALVAEFPTRR
jgi:signal transduction histidine kinase